jgi:hypothetical protein
MAIGDDEADASKSPFSQTTQKRRPEGPVFAVPDINPEHLTIAIGAHAGGNDDGPGDHPATDTSFHIGGVTEQVGELAMVEAPCAEGLELFVELGTDPRGLGLRDTRGDTQGLHEIVDLSRRNPVHVGLHDDGIKSPIDSPPSLEDLGEERTTAQFRYSKLDVTGLRRQKARTMAVAIIRSAI